MALHIDPSLTPARLAPSLERVFELSAEKILNLEKSWSPTQGTPVFTIRGRYTSRGWTDWTQGFQYGSALLQFDATGDRRFLGGGPSRDGRAYGVPRFAHWGPRPRLQQRLHLRNIAPTRPRRPDRCLLSAERDFYQLALKVSGAVQAARWTRR